MKTKTFAIAFFAIAHLMFVSQCFAEAAQSKWPGTSVRVEYVLPADPLTKATELPVYEVANTLNTRITTYRNTAYQLVLHEINRGSYTEINGELQYLGDGNSCVTLRVILPLNGTKWKCFKALINQKK